MNTEKLKIDATWLRAGPSRFITWNLGLRKLENWLRQKNYPYGAANMAKRFSHKYGEPGSLTDAVILASQHFSAWREFVNKYHKSKQSHEQPIKSIS